MYDFKHYYTSLKISSAKALYRRGCYIVRPHGYITHYLRKTNNRQVVAMLSPVTSLSFIPGLRLWTVCETGNNTGEMLQPTFCFRWLKNKFNIFLHVTVLLVIIKQITHGSEGGGTDYQPLENSWRLGWYNFPYNKH